ARDGDSEGLRKLASQMVAGRSSEPLSDAEQKMLDAAAVKMLAAARLIDSGRESIDQFKAMARAR
ncbi:MAG: hypothetical protein Q8P61_08000, partial [Candidatus Nanopelagicales bacterium]|nr:hypothetical protein [Candidatus Nanopelagicales bacterium]